MPDAKAAAEAGAYLETCMQNQDSAGGVVECKINGVPAGLGDPVFGKLDAILAEAVMSIGAVKAVEIGDGFAVSRSNGSNDNDGFTIQDGQIIKTIMQAASWAASVMEARSFFVPLSNQPHPFLSHRAQ